MFLTWWNARDGSGWLGASSAAPVALHAAEVFYGCRRRDRKHRMAGTTENGFVDLHCLSSSHPGFDSIDPPGAKVGPGFVDWIARVTPDCVLDASIEIMIGTENQIVRSPGFGR